MFPQAPWHNPPVDNTLSPQHELDQVLAAEQERRDSRLPADYKLVLQRAIKLETLARFDAALQACDEALQLIEEQGLPNCGEAIVRRGWIQYRQGRKEEALAAYAEAEHQFSKMGLPVLPSISLYRGSIFTDSGRYAEAFAEFADYERLCHEQGLPVHPVLANNRGGLLLLLGRYKDALEEFGRSEHQYIEQGLPVFPGLADNRGLVYGKLGMYEEAMAAYDESERMFRERGLPQSWELNFNRAMTMYEVGHTAEAIQQACKAIYICGEQGVTAPDFLMETLRDWLAPKPDQLVKEQKASQPVAIEPVRDNEKKYDAFICYRRSSSLAISMLLKTHLDLGGKSVFRDQDDLHKGRFQADIMQAIRLTRHLVVLMSPGFFARCITDENDILRQELAAALHYGTHIIPVMMEGFSWPAPTELPEDIRAICEINAMSYSAEFFSAFMDKLLRWMSE